MVICKQDPRLLFLIIGYIVVSCGTVDTSQKLPAICQSKCKKSLNGTETWKFCKDKPHLAIQERCCINSSAMTVVGIDLEDCAVDRKMFVTGIKSLSHLVILSLEGNPITTIKKTDFTNNTEIQYLSLPPKIHCPGGKYAWENETYAPDKTVCMDELNPCTAWNYTCPDNSYCEHVGVNTTYCLCDEGFHGYKCMKEGSFPFLIFGIGMGAPTFVLSVFLWITQRRHVKTKPKYTQ